MRAEKQSLSETALTPGYLPAAKAMPNPGAAHQDSHVQGPLAHALRHLVRVEGKVGALGAVGAHVDDLVTGGHQLFDKHLFQIEPGVITAKPVAHDDSSSRTRHKNIR